MNPKPFFLAVCYFVAMILIAHFFAPSNYDWTQNTISDLGSQGHAYNWIMRVGFIGFGLVLTLGVIRYSGQNATRRYFLLFVAIYGISVFITGIFSAAPIVPVDSYSTQEAGLHSIFATVAGISMSLGIFRQFIVSSNLREWWTRLVFFLLVMGISVLFGVAENHILDLDKGIVQRFLYLAGLAWLVYEERILFSERENKQ